MNIKTILFISASATSQLSASAAITVINEKTSNSPIAYFLALQGAYAHSIGAHEQAAKTYGHLSKVTPHDTALTHAHIKLNFDRRRYQEVVNAAAGLDPANKLNKDSLFMTAQSLLFTHQEPAALNLLTQLIANYPQDDRLYYFATITHTKTQQLPQAQALIKTVLDNQAFSAKHYLFHFLNAQVALLQNNPTQAHQALTECLMRNSSFAQAWLLRASIQEKEQLNAAALTTYERYLSLCPNDKAVVPLMVKLALKTANHTKAQELLTRYPATTVSYFYDKALLHLANKQHQEAHDTLTVGLIQHPSNSSLQELFIKQLLASEAFNKIKPTFISWQKNIHEPDTTKQLIALCRKTVPPKLANTIIYQLQSGAQPLAQQPPDQLQQPAPHNCPLIAG